MAAERPELNRLEVLRALRISNWEAVWSTTHFSLTSGAFQTGYALWLGANSFWMGVLSSIPTFSGLVQVVSSYFVERRGERKLFTAWFSVAGRVLWIPILLIPFVLPGEMRFVAFVALLLLSSVLISVPIPAFMSWMSDLVPPDHRGRYFARRAMVAGITGMLATLPAAWFLDLATKAHRFAPAVGFAAVFGAASLCGIGSFLCLLRQPEPPMRRQNDGSATGLRALAAFYRAPFAEANFRRFLAFSALFAVGQFFAAPFFTVYALEVLRLDYVWLQVLGAVSGSASLLSMPLWGYLSDKFGNKPLLAIAVFGVSLLPVGWVFTSPARPGATLVILLLLNLGGVFWAGVGLIQFNMLIALTPSERKSVYVAAMSAVTGLAGGIAPILGGVVMTWLSGAHVHVLGLTLSNYHLVFTLNTVLRFSALLMLGAVLDPGARSARTVLTQLGATRVAAWKHIRQLQRSSTEQGRREAAQALRSSRTALAVEELAIALDDPSLRVREEAAEALGDIGDARAVDALIARLDDPGSGIVVEAAAALGRIGDSRAVDPLTRLLCGGSRLGRLAAARSLGRIGDPAALPHLFETLGAPDADDEVREACARAIGAIGDPAGAAPLIDALSDGSHAVRTAAVRALGDLGDPQAVAPLIALLAGERDAALIANIAAALALMGAPEAVRPLLAGVERIQSPVARKQVLSAVGSLIGEGDTAYPLLTAESFARDEAISRMLREAHRASAGDGGFGAKRRARQFERALEHYTAGRLSEAAALLARLAAATPPGPRADVLEWATELAARRPLESDEFVLVLCAARPSTR